VKYLGEYYGPNTEKGKILEAPAEVIDGLAAQGILSALNTTETVTTSKQNVTGDSKNKQTVKPEPEEDPEKDPEGEGEQEEPVDFNPDDVIVDGKGKGKDTKGGKK
jgi:hypothetical protein